MSKVKTETSTKGIRKGKSPDRKPRLSKRFHYRKRSPKRYHSRSRQSKRRHTRSRSREHKRMQKHRSTSYRQEGSSSTQVSADESCFHIPATQAELPKAKSRSKKQSTVSSFTSTVNTMGRKSRSRSREKK